MNINLLSLYTKYLFGKFSKDEFLEMRYLINNLSRKDLETITHEVWNEDHSLPKMPKDTKNRIKQNLDFLIQRDVHQKRKSFIKIIASAAASIAIIFGAVFLYLNKDVNNKQEYFTIQMDKGQKASVKLPDNTLVKLNALSNLIYDTNDSKYRKVFLQGEAYFEVKKDEKRPFIVSLGELQIEVLGTHFNVQTYNNEDVIEASLLEGSIKLVGKRFSETYILKPMEKVIYSKKDASLRIVSVDKQAETGWMDERLVFTSEPLSKIVRKIERWYGVSIDLQCPEIRNDLMTGSFYKEELLDVLKALEIQYRIQYTISENRIVITKPK